MFYSWGEVDPSPHCTWHFNSQLLMADGGWVPPPHNTCHFNSQLPMADGVGGFSFTLHTSLQLSTANGWWGVVFPPSHQNVTSTLNFQWVKGVGWYPPHFTSNGSHIIWGWLGGWYPPHFTSSQSHINWDWSWGYPPHLTNQLECASVVKPNWLPSLYASTA